MKPDRSHPPRLAVWLLRHVCPSRNREAITGDLLERFGEGRSGDWFWRQVLVAILAGAASEFRLWTDIFVGVAGTALIWCVPWGQIFPLAAMTSPSMNLGARLLWLIAIEITTALMVLPLFAILFRLRGALNRASLLRVFFISGVLFTAADLSAFWWDGRYPISRSQATWAVPIMHASIFAALLISARVARGLGLDSDRVDTGRTKLCGFLKGAAAHFRSGPRPS